MADPKLAAARGIFGHSLARMTGRNPREAHRAATPLELLFDLAFVVALGQAADQFAHLVAGAHVASAIGAFAFSIFAICWAWINFTWFASAYDTDDWFYRLTTMLQMIGVVVLALGLPAVFHSLDQGTHLDNGVTAAGYVIMRVAMVVQWLRVARQDPLRRRTALFYAGFITLAQIGWVAVAALQLPLAVALSIVPLLYLLELGGPIVAELTGEGTPWHPHHIAERYGLFAIIALGEGVFGTVASVAAVIEHQGWSIEVGLVMSAGIGLTFGLWWSYFVLPSGVVLARHRSRSFVWGYGHMLVYASIAATGAGLHVAAYVIEGTAAIGTLGAIVAVCVPVAVFSVVLFGLYTYLVREGDPLHILLFAGTLALLGGAIALAAAGASLGMCLIIATLSPAVVIVGYETVGHRHEEAVLARALK